MQLSKLTLANLIRQNAYRLQRPDGIDAVKLLWALAGNESSFGANATARHEASYCPNCNGSHAKKIEGLTRLWGCLAHCSYGAWQVMFPNTHGVTPAQMDTDPQAAIEQTIRFLNTDIFTYLGARTLEQIGCAYNMGRLPGENEKLPYVTDLLSNYEAPLPE